jgi:DNA helicase-2/ATP-dependent DNA helicase PcrA
VRALSILHPNLCVTGDPDQSIYGWRGANIDNILRFERDFPTAQVVRLEQNYRSTQAVLRVADQLIQNNVRRMSKSLVTDNDHGRPVRLVAYPTPQHEATDIVDSIVAAMHHVGREPKDFAILYRANWLSRTFEHELRARQIPYLIVHGQEFYQRREIKDVFAYLHLMNNPNDHVAIQRIINVPPRKIGKATLDKLKRDALDQRRSILESARLCGLNESISKQAAAKVAAFVATYDRLGEVRQETSVRKIIQTVLAVTGYRDFLLEDDSENGHERAANVDELLVAAEEFDHQHPEDGGLEAFLESTALVNDVDDLDGETNAVSLMTLHAAKGLEFPVVYIVGLEDGLLPHERSSHSDAEIEEERRLLFVGITRAEEELQLSRVVHRNRRGERWPTIASRFLMELPRAEMEVFGSTSYEFYGSDEPAIDRSDADDPLADDFDWETGQFREAPGGFAAPGNAPQADEPPRPTDANKKPRLMTAAKMFDIPSTSQSSSRARIPVEVFQQGMPVEHPEYGAGIILTLSGTGQKRVAQVAFADCELSFRLAHCPLRPIQLPVSSPPSPGA